MKNFTGKSEFKTVVAIGKFDGVHLGHMKLIEKAVDISKEYSMKSLVYIVAPDNHKLIIPDEQRMMIFETAGVDFCCREKLTPEFMAMTPDEFVGRILVEELNCSHVVVGYNFRFGTGRCAGAYELERLCEQHGIKAVVVDEVRVSGEDGKLRTVSSSLVREFLSKGDFANANRYLGYRFSIEGTVQKGRQLGRTIGFPTANIVPGNDVPEIANGVYATLCVTECGEFLGITNIGNNPTVDTCNPVTIETNIFDFSEDLYGKKIAVMFLSRLRGEKKFPSLSALKNQIEKDKQYALEKYGK